MFSLMRWFPQCRHALSAPAAAFLSGLSAGDERIMMLPQHHCNYSRESRTESRGRRTREAAVEERGALTRP